MIKSKKEIVVMLLAGGRGLRLRELTNNMAKPAVRFGGKYRLIDFTLSNCCNSGINTVGVLTQYNPLELNYYIGIGTDWYINRPNGTVTILPPYIGLEGGRWYKGTANAIYENIDFVDIYEPKYVLILSGDHIYKMNYYSLLEYHKKKESLVTIAATRVPWEQTSRFGIMNIDNDNRIYEFEEKAKNATNNLASMGVYIFNWNVLKKYLIEDEKNSNSSNDFGKDIIPKMLEDRLDMFAYEFKGYWRDVGTVESLWRANMDLLKENSELNLYDNNWNIYSKHYNYPPHYVGKTGKVKSSILGEGCIIHGEVQNSVLSPGVYIGKNSKVIDSVVMPNVIIKNNVVLERVIVMEHVVVKSETIIKNRNDKIFIVNDT
ncbi:glucose-1-phosphate adenylyltransferase [Tepidibacter aestuarii]|uniref:glucose-1-phosphate adenylyltransferase n=1 Tax=Tepidibacter aestuarii TaxID=2925782 RepID=UPI00273A735C|nr:glucose-1-phosphate adenylyltransferase [Tepidibacter aestuarii]CAH2214395.1 glucose-1-phosphate adenylyltransferase (ADP-glucose pyrophosphorylase) subunit alpha [Tepidibacter aestuarii]